MKKTNTMPPSWHTLAVEELTKKLDADLHTGLTNHEVLVRQNHFGMNQIQKHKPRSLFQLFFHQFFDFMIIVLLLAAIVAGIVGEPIDSLAIMIIVMLNALVGTFQEYRAEKAVAALRKMAAPDALVRRDGTLLKIPAEELVPGDIVQLEAGNVVPADLRLFEVADLRAEEAALTGESASIFKNISTLATIDIPLGDRTNMAYKGTQISHGRGMGIVIGTGMQTELGRIATLLSQEKAHKTPLQKRLEKFGRNLAVVILAIATILFITGILRGEALILMFLTAISLAVAAIPEALPAIVTMSLALGARKMSRQNALVRRLPAVETLGSVTYICSDKTGTITENRMHLEAVWIEGQVHTKGLPKETDKTSVRLMGQALALNNDVVFNTDNKLLGDPTEIALSQAAEASGFHIRELMLTHPRVAEIPFDAIRKCMSTLHQEENDLLVLVKGAPEMLLKNCSSQLINDKTEPLSTQTILDQSDAFAQNGYRVLAFAYKRLSTLPASIEIENIESELIFLGLAALIDPPRKEAKEAVEHCLAAGITPVIITGDHPVTALAIASRVGIASKESRTITGEELDKMSPKQLALAIKDIRIYARVSPKQKITIVKALQEEGQYVAMTGDGVNDAPSLKSADIGIAMGKQGTDVAREAADMVLLDDNFATIVRAIKEGRRIYDNIRKFVKYTMTSNSGEIWTLFLAPFLGLPIPLLPIQILWINLVTDGLPGLALAAEPEEKSIMQRPPRPPHENIFSNGMWQHMLWVGLLIGGLSLISQAWSIHQGIDHWQTMVFTTLTLAQLANVMAIRSETHSLFQIGIFSNPYLLAAVSLTFLLQMLVIYTPMLQPVFQTAPLSATELLTCIGLASTVFVAVEIEKWLVRRGILYKNR